MGVEGLSNDIHPKNFTPSIPKRPGFNSSESKAREHDELDEDSGDLTLKSNDDLINLLENLKLEIPKENDNEEQNYSSRGKLPQNNHTCIAGQRGKDYLHGVKHQNAYQNNWDYNISHSVFIPRTYNTHNARNASLPANSRQLTVQGYDESCMVWKLNHELSKRKSDRTVTDGPGKSVNGETALDGPPVEYRLPINEMLEDFEIDIDGGPPDDVLEGNAWMEGIPQLDMKSDHDKFNRTVEMFDKAPSGIYVNDMDKDTLCAPPDLYPMSMYTPSPERGDEVLSMTNDKLSTIASPASLFQDDEDLQIIGHGSSPRENSVYSSSPETLPEAPIKLPLKSSPMFWTDRISDSSQPSKSKQQAYDTIERDCDGDSILHSCLIAEVPSCEFRAVLLALNMCDVLQDIINNQNESLRTALFLAVLERKPDIVKLLLKFGADPNIQGKVVGIKDSYELRSPLHLAAEMGDDALEILQLLLEDDKTEVDIHSESDRKTPLHIALLTHCVLNRRRPQVNCSKTIEALLRCGANRDLFEDTSSKTPIMMVIDTHDFQLLKMFLDSIDPDEVRLLLEAVTRGGDTPLHIAAGTSIVREHKIRLIRLLVSRGANTNVENNIKQLPEDIASRDLWREIFKTNKSTVLEASVK